MLMNDLPLPLIGPVTLYPRFFSVQQLRQHLRPATSGSAPGKASFLFSAEPVRIGQYCFYVFLFMIVGVEGSEL